MRAIIERTIRDGHETNRTPDDQLATCPVCGLSADLEGTLNIEFDASGDRDGVDVNPYGEYDAVSFSCRTCGLVLDSRRLIQASGVLEHWEVPWDDVQRILDAQSEDLWAEYEASGDRADYERDEADGENEPW